MEKSGSLINQFMIEPQDEPVPEEPESVLLECEIY